MARPLWGGGGTVVQASAVNTGEPEPTNLKEFQLYLMVVRMEKQFGGILLSLNNN